MEYEPHAYDSLPSLHHAAGLFKRKQAEDAIMGPIRDVFLREGAHKQYAITLLHKHFTILPSERLVDYGNVSVPWTAGDSTSATLRKYDENIIPRSLRLIDGKFQPYEFGFGGEIISTASTTFWSKLAQCLADLGLQEVLGVRSIDKRDPTLNVEITEGKANIMLPRGSVPEKDLIPALWVFGLDEDDRCHCREYCYKDKSGTHTTTEHGCG